MPGLLPMFTSKFGDARMEQDVGFAPLHSPALLITSVPVLLTEKEGQLTGSAMGC